ncbi:proteome of centrioles 1 [Xylocopa sonorina]|uniref:proteome of centrioles 1 n=1 Tax=Xylocopa sonorina TaxID=1818115 RepID=UPI00403AEF5D
MIETACDPTIEKHFKGHENAITSLCFHPETAQLVSSSLDKSIILWNLKESVRAYKFLGHKDVIFEVTYAPSGEVIASASRDRSVRIWVPKVTGQCIDFKAHSGAVRSIQFSPDGEKLVTASDDKSIKLWMVCQRKFLMSFVCHTSWVRCARFSLDGRLIVSCSDDKTIKLWDIVSGQCIRTFHDTKASSTYVEFHPSNSVIGSANTAGCVKLYDLRTASLYQHYATHKGPVNMVKFHPKGNFMLTASDDATMKVLDLLEGRPIYTLKGHATDTSVKSITFSSNGDFFASGGTDHQLLMWKTNFDKDDIAVRKMAHHLILPTEESKLEIKDEKLSEEGGEEQEEEESLHKKFSHTILQNEKTHCTVPDSEVLNEKIQYQVINMRNQRPPEVGRIVNISHLSKKPPNTYSSKIVDALNEQVQSLCDAVTVLEQRLSVLEEELRK